MTAVIKHSWSGGENGMSLAAVNMFSFANFCASGLHDISAFKWYLPARKTSNWSLCRLLHSYVLHQPFRIADIKPWLWFCFSLCLNQRHVWIDRVTLLYSKVTILPWSSSKVAFRQRWELILLTCPVIYSDRGHLSKLRAMILWFLKIDAGVFRELSLSCSIRIRPLSDCRYQMTSEDTTSWATSICTLRQM